jgi:hypothetical protein
MALGSREEASSHSQLATRGGDVQGRRIPTVPGQERSLILHQLLYERNYNPWLYSIFCEARNQVEWRRPSLRVCNAIESPCAIYAML